MIKVHSRKPNPGRVHVAHILIAFPKDSAIQDSSAFLAKAQAIYKQVQEGADFGELAKEYSGDAASAKKGGYYLGSGSARWSSLLSKPLLR